DAAWRWTIDAHEGGALGATFSLEGYGDEDPSNTQILTAGADGTARLWDTRTGAALRVLRGHDGRVWSAAFGDSGRILTAGADGTARIWPTAELPRGLVWAAHAGGAYRAGFRPGVAAACVA